MIEQVPYLFNDFSGGITENYIDPPANKHKPLTNFVIDKNTRKPVERDG